MRRAAKTKSRPKPKAVPAGQSGVLEPGLDGMAKRTSALFSASPIEAAVSLERLADSCQKWVLEEDLLRERGRLIRQRDELEYGSKPYDRVQAKIDEIAARKVKWDAAWMPLMLLERRLRELAATLPELKKAPSASECWDVVAPIAVLANEHLKGLPAELTPWSDGIGDGAWCRQLVRSNLEAKPAIIRGMISSCEAALAHLEQRGGVQRATDTLDSLRGLRSLLVALSFLREELLEPGLHLKPAEWDAVLARAREQARTIGENWPAGACAPVALKARDDVASRLGLALARLSKPERTRLPRHAETLDEGIALLDQYVGPVCGWKPLPLPIAHLTANTHRDADSGKSKPPSETWRTAAWIVAACAEYNPSESRLTTKDLWRARDRLQWRKSRRDTREYEYTIESVLALAEFECYRKALLDGIENGFALPKRIRDKRETQKSVRSRHGG